MRLCRAIAVASRVGSRKHRQTAAVIEHVLLFSTLHTLSCGPFAVCGCNSYTCRISLVQSPNPDVQALTSGFALLAETLLPSRGIWPANTIKIDVFEGFGEYPGTVVLGRPSEWKPECFFPGAKYPGKNSAAIVRARQHSSEMFGCVTCTP